MDKPAVRDAALLVLRVVVGGVLMARGLNRVLIVGASRTTQQFANWGLPMPHVTGYVVSLSEIGAGALLVIGLLSTFIAALAAVMVGVGGYLVNLPNGFFAEDQGVEYPLVMVAALLMIVVFGPGRASVDRVLASDQVTASD